MSKLYYGEDKIQMVCVKWFYWKYREYFRLLHHSANEGNGDERKGARLKAMGVQAGVPDLMLFVARQGYHGLGVELKTKTGQLRPTQKEYRELLEAQGYKYVVCRSLEDFAQVMTEYLGAAEDHDRKRLNEILNQQ